MNAQKHMAFSKTIQNHLSKTKNLEKSICFFKLVFQKIIIRILSNNNLTERFFLELKFQKILN